MKHYTIEFPETPYEKLVLPENVRLTEYLTPGNSPVLFGCCNGICGTCLIQVLAVEGGELSPPEEEEYETLENYIENIPNARLACQIRLTANLKIKKIQPNI